MKQFCLFFITICLLIGKGSADSPKKLIIHMDVNRTIIGIDKIQKKGLKGCLNSTLAKRCKAKWDPSVSSPISYYKYLYTTLVPGSRENKEISKTRKVYLNNFLNYLEANHPDLHQKALEDIHAVFAKRAESPFFIFPSFHKFLTYLENSNVEYTIVFRTFGNDINEVSDELRKKHSFVKKIVKGKLHQGILHIDGKVLRDKKEIYEFLNSHKFIAIQDDFFYWQRHKEKQPFGKPFYINKNAANTLSLFFDDNVIQNSDDGTNIVNPLDIDTNLPLSVDPFLDAHYIIQADMIEAILDEDYFIHHLNAALHMSQNS